MKVKNLLFATLVLGIGLVSCQDKIEGEGVLVDVTLNSKMIDPINPQKPRSTSVGVDPETKLGVTSGGTTSWRKNDEVFLVDMIGVPRSFIANAGGAKANFTGKLLAGRGEQTYYAYYPAPNSPCQLDVVGGKRNITVIWGGELNYHSNDATNGVTKGNYCSMIGLPLTFEAENPNDFKSFSFYHANTLIEAQVESEIGGYNLKGMVFNKVVFTVEAIPAPGSDTFQNPFNTEVTFDMKKITFDLDGDTYSNVNIPLLSEGSEKINKMTTTITYDDNTTFESRMTADATYYDIHIFALPTKTDFKYIADVYFYNNDVTVCHLQYKGDGITKGLKSGALNPISFAEPVHIVEGPVI